MNKQFNLRLAAESGDAATEEQRKKAESASQSASQSASWSASWQEERDELIKLLKDLGQ